MDIYSKLNRRTIFRDLVFGGMNEPQPTITVIIIVNIIIRDSRYNYILLCNMKIMN